MFRGPIPVIFDEDFANLTHLLAQVVENSAIYDYRQHELNQIPSQEVFRKAEQIASYVEGLKKSLNNTDPAAAQVVIDKLESELSMVTKSDLDYLQKIIQQLAYLVDKAKKIITRHPDFISAARKDELSQLLATANQELDEAEILRVINESDKRLKAFSGLKASHLIRFFVCCGNKVAPITEELRQDLSPAFDHCVDKAYKKFNKTDLGRYLQKYQEIIEKRKHPADMDDQKLLQLKNTLAELRAKLSLEEQKKLEMIKLSGKSRLDLLTAFLPPKEYNDFLIHLQKSIKTSERDLLLHNSALGS